MVQLRGYQQDIDRATDDAWASGDRNVCAVLPTGAGKTIVFANKLAQTAGVRFAIAHRQELISQISMALAKFGVVHRITAPAATIKWIIRLHTKTYGRHYYDPDSPCILISVQTLLSRADTLWNAINAARLWVIDECHHITRGNIWGKAVGLFPEHCKGLGVTATPLRSDGKGLGRHADGVFDTLVTGPGMRDLITAGYLTDYRIFAPQTTIDLSAVPVGGTGDYSKPKLVAAVRKSQIVGDVVDHYLRIAPGKLGVTFVTDVQTGRDTAERFRAMGVPSEIVHAKTADRKRQGIVESFGRGDVKNLVNVDIFGEGFDLPAMEVCSFARPTESYGLYVQQFGRGLRTMDGKGSAIIIDHVGNVMRHGLPDKPRVWSLDAREKRQSNGPTDVMPVRVCRVCTGVYEPYLKTCPYCGWVYEPDARATIEQVEGDLMELDPEALAAMRGERDRIDSHECGLERSGAPGIAVAGARKQHRLRQEAQAELRAAISGWADRRRAAGIPDHISYRDFYAEFGIDVMGAQLLGRPGAMALMERIK